MAGISLQGNEYSNRILKILEILQKEASNSSQTIILAKERITVWFLSRVLNEFIGDFGLSAEHLVGRPDSKSLIVRMSERDQQETVRRFK